MQTVIALPHHKLLCLAIRVLKCPKHQVFRGVSDLQWLVPTKSGQQKVQQVNRQQGQG